MRQLLQIVAVGGISAFGFLSISGCHDGDDRHRHVQQIETERRAEVYDYEYYPDSEVYYYPQRRVYYWRESGEWRNGDRLPAQRHLEDRPVTVQLRGERPYEFHEEVRVKHPGKARGHDDDKDKDRRHDKDDDRGR